MAAGNGARKDAGGFRHWDEVFQKPGEPREIYARLLAEIESLPRPSIRALDERLEATMREMGVTFDISRDRPWGGRPWLCDLLPQVFAAAEWNVVENALRQRIEAFELFLADIYGPREILRSGKLPVQPVLGSAYRQRVAEGLPRPGGAFLHLSGAAMCRLPDGRLAFKHHYFSNASGISYMIQNRRALARVLPGSFGDLAIRSLTEVPTIILESLHAHSKEPDPTVVLLTPGSGSAVYSEHAFLSRRMGIPLVQGGDLLVLDETVYLKTVSGLEKVEVIYTRLSDAWLDPMTFRRDSVLGVPGLVHCIRRGSVAVVNAIGSQLADDRALLPFSAAIIGYYLGQRPLLPTLETFWLGDIDQREHVLAEIENFTIRPLYGEKILLGGDGKPPSERARREARAAIASNPGGFVAQSQDCDAIAPTYFNGSRQVHRQDHIVFALRRADGWRNVLPGALTRTTSDTSLHTANELGGGSKDTWVEEPPGWNQPLRERENLEFILPARHVGSRDAEAFYWVGRYLERAAGLATMIRVIETLELEELNPTERTLYRPVWNKILPPLENPRGVTRRTISSPAGRSRLALDPDEPDSVFCAVLRAAANGESVLEALSLEAWSVLDGLRRQFHTWRFRPRLAETRLAASTRKACEEVARRVPEFFGTAESTMVADGAWAFCCMGRQLERAIITANAITSILEAELPGGSGSHDEEIRLSALLRLLASRDVYRRVYQMRVELDPLLELLWANQEVPKSVARCLDEGLRRLRKAHDLTSPATGRALDRIEAVRDAVLTTRWRELLEADPPRAASRSRGLLSRLLELHNTLSDGFLNHQIHIRTQTQPSLFGPKNAF